MEQSSNLKKYKRLLNDGSGKYEFIEVDYDKNIVRAIGSNAWYPLDTATKGLIAGEYEAMCNFIEIVE